MNEKHETPGEDEPRFVNPATGKALTAAELEKKLLKELKEAAAEYRESLYRLALFQFQVKRQPEAAGSRRAGILSTQKSER